MNTLASDSSAPGGAVRKDRARVGTMAVAVASFALCGVTGVVMFLHRRGPLVDELHTWSGIALLVGMVLHLIRHRRSLAQYLRHWVVWAPLAVALFLSGVVLAVTNTRGHGPQVAGPTAQHNDEH
ncbi:DUF4405 domain-containing protein [Opitutus terrae]|nr:DUF4405 domain-containing protein [Opitutus terrae]